MDARITNHVLFYIYDGLPGTFPAKECLRTSISIGDVLSFLGNEDRRIGKEYRQASHLENR